MTAGEGVAMKAVTCHGRCAATVQPGPATAPGETRIRGPRNASRMAELRVPLILPVAKDKTSTSLRVFRVAVRLSPSQPPASADARDCGDSGLLPKLRPLNTCRVAALPQSGGKSPGRRIPS